MFPNLNFEEFVIEISFGSFLLMKNLKNFLQKPKLQYSKESSKWNQCYPGQPDPKPHIFPPFS